jgi:hypothetical protein
MFIGWPGLSGGGPPAGKKWVLKMSGDAQLYKTAWGLMKRHGTDGAIEFCRERVEEMTREHNREGVLAWRSVQSCIQELDRKPAPGERLN